VRPIADPKYKKIIRLIENKSAVNLNICRISYPEISSGTFHSTLSKLKKHGLVKKDSKDSGLTTYTKTNKFTMEKAIEVIRANRAVSIEQEKLRRLEDDVLKAVNNVVDPATGLTFAETQMIINVEKKEPGFVQIEFIPPFCPLALEFTTYIENAVMRVLGVKKTSIRCCGQPFERQNNRSQTKTNQHKPASAKGLLEYLK